MIEFDKITVENFGPYKDTEVLPFHQDGVTILYGENMRGKTTLLNVFRYALYGKVLTRGERELELHQIPNSVGVKEGNLGFSVSLDFKADGHAYQLKRILKPKPGVSPASDADYTQEVFLTRNGSHLSTDEAEQDLLRLMPERVARFFLFDGELLQQYEELLLDGDMGKEIKKAIEKILGVPVLTDARDDMTELLREAQKQEAKAAQRDLKTKELGEQQARLLDLQEGHEGELDRLREKLESLKHEKARINESRKKYGRVERMLDDRERLEDEVKTLEQSRDEASSALRNDVSTAWRGVLEPKLKDLYDRLLSDVESTQRGELDKGVAAELRAIQGVMAAELRARLTPVAGELSATTAASVVNEVLTARADELESRDIVSVHPHHTSNALRLVSELRSPDKLEDVLQKLDAVEDIKISISRKQGEISDIDEDIKGVDHDDIRSLSSDFESCITQIATVADGIKAEQGELDRVNQDLHRVESKLTEAGGSEAVAARRKRELAAEVRDLLSAAVDVYRDRLRDKVEKDASRLFKMMTTEPEYEGLRINDNYGLTIVHNGGDQVPVRSAGAEHVVALALVGALQRNAPRSGPIIMDSPFGRLDEGHTQNVVRALPHLSSQVMLLVYRKELSPDEAKNLLKGNLKAEFEIGRHSALHSYIKRQGS